MKYMYRVGVAPSLYLRVVAIEEGAFGSPSTTVANFTCIWESGNKADHMDERGYFVYTQGINLPYLLICKSTHRLLKCWRIQI